MPSSRRPDAGLYFRQPIEIGAQHPALQDKVCELAFAEDFDQAGGLVNVSATLPDQSAAKTSSAVVQPRATVVVPSFDFQ